MSVSQLNFLLDQQYELYDSVALAVGLLNGAANVTRPRIQTRLEALKENWGKFKENHDLLGSGKAAQKVDVRTRLEEDSYFKDKMFRSCEQNYLDAVERMTAMLEEVTANTTATGAVLADQPFSRPINGSSSVRLPRLEIPTFSGEYSEWVAFKDMFTSVIGANASLTLVEKLQYLKTHLSGKAADRLKNVTLTAANFQTAWDDLVTYYDNKRILVDSALHALFTAKQVTSESASELETLYSEICQALGALDGLNRSIDKWDDVIVYVISRKLDSASIKEWERSLGSSTNPPTWKELKTFLITRIRSLQAYERATPDVAGSSKPGSHKNQPNKAKSHHVATSSTPKCAHCQGEHYLASCSGYQSMTTEQRNELVKKLRLCVNCLGPHRYNKCFSKKRCQSCGGKHHTSIHLSSPPTSQSTASTGQPVSSSIVSTNVASIHRAPKLSKILTTALVKLFSKTGESFIIRALLDQGSEVNLASENLIQLLRLPRNRSSLAIVGIGADSSSSRSARGHVNLKLQSRVNEFTCSFDAYILPKLTNYLPSAIVVDEKWAHLQGLELADPGFCQPGRIDLILGVEIYGQILQNGLRKGEKTSPIAQQTSLGWIISGSASASLTQITPEAVTLHCQLNHDYELNDLVKKFVMQEEIFNSPKGQLTPEEIQCDTH